jgi:hypothetical protein
VAQLKSAIVKHTKAQGDLTGDLRPAPHFTANSANRFVFARLQALVPVHETHCRTDLLRVLLDVGEYLSKNPRYFYINVRHAAQAPADFELQSIGDAGALR